MENFFRRLETYIEVPQTPNMADIIVKVMVEVLFILSIATKELNQTSASELTSDDGLYNPLTYRFLEAFLKKLVGRTDIEDALQRLDKLTQEEARMATAEGLKATHGIDSKVEDVGDKVKGVDNKIQLVDKMIQGVDNKIHDIHVRVKDVGDQIAGAQITFI